MTRADQLRNMAPQLIADVRLYSAADGGRTSTAYPGWGCPCIVSNGQLLADGWNAWPLLDGTTLEPGAERRLGFVFMSGEGLRLMRAAGKFYLWEGGFIGEATVVG